METQRNPNEPGKSGGPGQQGGQQQERDKGREGKVVGANRAVVAANVVAVNKEAAAARRRRRSARRKIILVLWIHGRREATPPPVFPRTRNTIRQFSASMFLARAVGTGPSFRDLHCRRIRNC